MLEMLAIKTLYGGQFPLSTQLFIPAYLGIPPLMQRTIVSLETAPLYSFEIEFDTCHGCSLDDADDAGMSGRSH